VALPVDYDRSLISRVSRDGYLRARDVRRVHWVMIILGVTSATLPTLTMGPAAALLASA